MGAERRTRRPLRGPDPRRAPKDLGRDSAPPQYRFSAWPDAVKLLHMRGKGPTINGRCGLSERGLDDSGEDGVSAHSGVGF